MLRPAFALLALTAVAQSASYQAETEAFRQERAINIGAETGWAALTDLVWLERQGRFSIGRDASNAIVLQAPSAPPHLGTLEVTDQAVALQMAATVPAELAGRPVAQHTFAPNTSPADSLKVGGMTLALIERGEKRGLRVWDRLSPTRQAFQGLRWYPIDPKWNVEARFVPHEPAPTMRIQNIVGQIVEIPNPGAAVFTVDGREYRLEALLEAPDVKMLFFMFRDATSGTTTYGAGRYLYAPLPADGRLGLDFNRAINPPCAFTNYATCPLPPASNRLSVAIEAGEMDYGH
jgi:hypothetical protein